MDRQRSDYVLSGIWLMVAGHVGFSAWVASDETRQSMTVDLSFGLGKNCRSVAKCSGVSQRVIQTAARGRAWGGEYIRVVGAVFVGFSNPLPTTAPTQLVLVSIVVFCVFSTLKVYITLTFKWLAQVCTTEQTSEYLCDT